MQQSDRDELLKTFIEIEPLTTDDFLKVRETLTRIGLVGRFKKDSVDGKPTLWQSCHVFHKAGRYFIVHFKQMFLMDGRVQTQFTQEDEDRTKSIADLLERWNLVKIISPFTRPEERVAFTVISYNEKDDFNLLPKYTIGIKKLNQDKLKSQ
jgi:hypothetical protein